MVSSLLVIVCTGNEAACMLNLFNHSVSPAGVHTQTTIAAALAAVKAAGGSSNLSAQAAVLNSVSGSLNDGIAAAADLSAKVNELSAPSADLAGQCVFAGKAIKSQMAVLRKACDAVERVAPSSAWSLPTYHDMLFHQD
jgi:glutamine synthetase type III